jgi:hypothetical protein
MYRSSRQSVTGLVVNEKINVRREYRHNVRAMVHSLVNTGKFDLVGVTQKEDTAVLDKRPGTLNELHGRLGFIHSIEACSRKKANHDATECHGRRVTLLWMSHALERPAAECRRHVRSSRDAAAGRSN